MKKSVLITFILTMFLTLGVNILPTTVQTTNFGVSSVYASDLENALDNIQNGESAGIDADGEIKKKITGITKDILDIVMLVVLAILIVSGIIIAPQFKNAAENPQLKSRLKASLIGITIGIIFIINYFAFIRLIMGSGKLF